MGIRLGENRYGKAEVRLVHLDRSKPQHVIKDLNVTSQLIGDFTAAHSTGDNGRVIATDTQKNTVYALAKTGGVGAIEEFALRMARNFVDKYDWITGSRQEIEEYAWNSVYADGQPVGHSFVRGSSEVRTTVVWKDGPAETVISGLTDLVLLNSAHSEFHGFPQVEYTSLIETNDRILATACTARWVYVGMDPDSADWDALFTGIRALLLKTFATTHSLALQQTLYAMGEAVLQVFPEVGEIRFSMPNKHHFLVDMKHFGLDNDNEVFYAADRPYGLIQAAVVRDDAPVPPAVWSGIAGFI
ncbi:factor-independent urate hydroxylase [Nakamurella deserti]|uniref:factor-independent urate hydroxylase n=1 Tax=Nakamurella deserti TaxID=2164074 RepID=UPI000DBE8D12|nr:urate oxidase [Nakamurella deserti]